MELQIKQKFDVIDRFGTKYKIAEISCIDTPSWAYTFINKVKSKHIRLALDRYPEPLILQLRYTPKQILDRVPNGFRFCTLRAGCFGWSPKCTDLAKNTCELLRIPDKNNIYSQILTELFNLWRNEYYVVTRIDEI